MAALAYDELASINQCHSARLAGVPRAPDNSD